MQYANNIAAIDEPTAAVVKNLSQSLMTNNHQPIAPTYFHYFHQCPSLRFDRQRRVLSGGAGHIGEGLIGELDLYREAGIKPNFSDIAKRYGKDKHTVASYWKDEGGPAP